MIATTWVQITKAVLLLFGSTVLSVLVMKEFDYSFERLFSTAVAVHRKGAAIMSPGGIVADPISALSLGTALLFGTAGLPHILMRFFTVPDARAARHSVFVATGLIGYFYLLIVILGFGAIALLARDPQFLTPAGGLRGGDNMAAIHLSHVVAGDLFLGFISAVAFATILAVVSGLTLSGASAIAHDIYANVIRRGRATESEVVGISRVAAIALGVLAVVLGIAFEGQNVAYMVLLSFAVAASVNFPILFLSLYWRRLTTRGAVVGGSVGLLTACVCVVFGPTVWVDLLHHAVPLFPYKYPALFALVGCVSVTVLVSLTDGSARAAAEMRAFEGQYVRAVTGLGASGASEH
jgi:cation/acetate symporter